VRNFVTENRRLFAENIEDNSIAVIFSGNIKNKLGDEYYPFTPNRNFYYLTVVDRPNLILMLIKKDGITESIMFTERYDELKAKWVGAVIGQDECSELSGVERSSFKYIDEFDECFASRVFNGHTENVYLDLENRDFNADTPALKFASRLMSNYPALKIYDAHSILAKLRQIKGRIEIDRIKKAIEITGKGINAMLRNANAGMYEYEIEAYFDFELKKAGVKDFAFKSIAASGKNATVLHYSENNCRTKDNDLILCDVGAQYEYYNGDITRTFPVNGKFTPRQKQIYDIVLGGNRLIVDMIKPGIEFKSLNVKLKEYYAVELKRIGLIENSDEVAKYYYHGVSHMLGLETHDVGRHNEGLLKAGMVLTVEPGLYIAEEGIGIRIEDNVLVTENGYEVLSPDIPRTTEEIEAVMAEGR
jgi:Xaa-Pro aminopeptidase